VTDDASRSISSADTFGIGSNRAPEPLATAAYRRQREHVPPLSIRYLLLWTATTAVALLVFNILGMQQARVGAWGGLLAVLAGMIVGWIWMSVAILSWHYWHKTLWILEPGERLLLVPGGLLSLLLPLALIGSLSESAWLAVLVSMWILSGVGALYARAIVEGPGSDHWIGVYWINMVMFLTGVCAMAPLLSIVGLVLPPLGFFLVIRGFYRDRREKVPRHWLHYSGAGLFSLALGVLVAMEFAGIGGFLLFW